MGPLPELFFLYVVTVAVATAACLLLNWGVVAINRRYCERPAFEPPAPSRPPYWSGHPNAPFESVAYTINVGSPVLGRYLNPAIQRNVWVAWAVTRARCPGKRGD